MKSRRRLVEEQKHGFDADAKGLFEMVADQFSDPNLFIREAVQNAVDESPREIHITTNYDKDQGHAIVSIEDDGNGMDYEGIRRYLTLFDSTKEGIKGKIGEFGIGKLSAFAVQPEIVTIETGRNGESHGLVIESSGKGSLHKIQPRKGTKVTVYKEHYSEFSAQGFFNEIENVLSSHCRYISIPLVINSNQINTPFEIESPHSTRKTAEGDLELALGLTSTPERKYLKGGIVLEEIDLEHGWTFKNYRHVAFLADSFDFDQTISRNRVLPNKAFGKIENSIKREIHTFVSEIAQRCHDGSISIDSPFILPTCIDYLVDVRNGKIPRSVLTLPLFPTVFNSHVSLKDIRKAHARENVVYFSTSRRYTDDLSHFTERKIPVLLFSEGEIDEKAKEYLEREFRNVRDIDSTILMEQLPDDELNNNQRAYLTSLNRKYMARTVPRLEIPDLVGDYESYELKPSWDERSKIERIELGDFSTVYRRKEGRQMFQSSKGVIYLNVNNEFVSAMIELASNDPRLSAFYTYAELMQSEELFPFHYSRYREDRVLSLAKRMNKGSGGSKNA